MFRQAFPLFRFIAIAVYMTIESSAVAQTVTAAQQKVCDQHRVGDWCSLLALEFYTTHALLAPTPQSPLDFPPGDTKKFAADLAPKAIVAELKSDLKTAAEKAGEEALQTISLNAATNQTGAASESSGSTNLTTKPTTTDFISMAAETGAFTESQNGSSLTLQANALGLIKYFRNDPIFRRLNSSAADALQPLTLSVTLDIAQSSSSAVATAGSANAKTPSIASILLPSNNAAFSSFGASYAVYRPYNPQDKKFLANWDKAVAANQPALAAAGSSIASAVNSLLTPAVLQAISDNLSGPLAQWHLAGVAAEKSANFNAFVSAYARYDNAFSDYILSRPDAPKAALALSRATAAFSDATYTVLDQARGTPLATVKYLYSSPAQKPATHSVTVVLSELFASGKPAQDAAGQTTDQRDRGRSFLNGAQLTGNFTAEIYASLPAGATYGRLRDLQASAELDKPFGGTLTNPRGTLSLAGYGQYQYDPTVLNIAQGNIVPGTAIPLPSDAQVLLGTSGWIGVAQGKVVFNLSKGLTIPVALKWSNKTDLLSGNDVRGQFGISYDLSALSKLISGSD